MKQLSIRQISLRYAFIMFGVVLLLSVVSFVLFRAWMIQQHTVEIQQALVIKADNISRQVGFYRRIVQNMAHQQKVIDLLQFGNEKEIFSWALGMQDFLPYNIGLALFGADGEVLGNPVEMRVGDRCVADLQGHIHGSQHEVPVHQRVASLAHFDIVENVRVDDQVVGAIFASFSLELLQQELDRITGADEVLRIYSDDQQLIAESGNTGARPPLLEKTLPVQGTGWKLHAVIAQPRMGVLLVQVSLVAICLFLLVSLIWYVFAKWLVTTFANDLARIQHLLIHVKDHHATQPDLVRSSLRETEHITQGIHNLAQDISFYQQRLVDFSITDELTGLFNRRAFNQQAQRCIDLVARGVPVSVVMLDLDYFKQANDSFGHAMGDDLLRGLSRCLRRSVRSTDVAARLGGDEFVVLLVQCTEEEAFNWYHKVAKEFESMQQSLLGVAADIRLCSVSAGFTQVTADDTDIDTVLRRADEALYKAKASGRGKMLG